MGGMRSMNPFTKGLVVTS